MIALLLASIISVGAAWAEPEPKPSSAASTPPAPPAAGNPEAAKPAAPPSPAPVPSLDELLGTTKPAPPTPAPAEGEAAPDATRDLDRLLEGAEIGEAFTQAVQLMDDAAKRLEGPQDPGITTQRVQEDVLKRLDQLLASLKQRQSSSSSSSSSSSQQNSDNQSQRNQPNQNRQGKRPGQQQAGQSDGDGQRQDLGPARQEGQLRPALDSARAAWGALPERVRDMLLQGSSDRFSAKYQALTEAYYKRLAEEKK